MKLSASNIPLTVFAASATGLVGLAFCAAPLSVLPYTIREHGLISFVPLLDVFVACTGLLVIVLSVAVVFRRRWAHVALVRSMFGLMIVTVFVLGRKVLQNGRSPSDRFMDVTAGPFILLAMGVVLLFLVNRRVQDELVPQPNQALEPTGSTSSRQAPTAVTPPASAFDQQRRDRSAFDVLRRDKDAGDRASGTRGSP
jgi:hypothetical protein